MKIKKVMSRKPVHYCTPATTLSGAAKVMKASNVGALPVVNKTKQVVGIVTDRDICLSIAKRNGKATQKIGDIMSKKVATVTQDDELGNALYQMRKLQVGRLPVVNGKGALTGIISLHSLLANATKRGAALSVFTADGRDVLNTVGSITSRYDKKNGRKSKAGYQPEEVYEVP